MMAVPKGTTLPVTQRLLKFKQHDSLAAKRNFRLLQNLANAKEKSTPKLRN